MDAFKIWENYGQTKLTVNSQWRAKDNGRLRYVKFNRGDLAVVTEVNDKFVIVKLRLSGENQKDLPKNGMKISGIEFQTGDPVILTRDLKDLSGMGSNEKFFAGDRGFVGYYTQATLFHVDSDTPGVDVQDLVTKPEGQFIRLVAVHFPNQEFIQVPVNALAKVSPTDEILTARDQFLARIQEESRWWRFSIDKQSFLNFFQPA